jgi:Polyketide cyclase / dehydrase and lipid transport
MVGTAQARLCPPYDTHPSNKESTTMASIHKEIIIDASPDHVWDALRDFGALHTRLVPGFVTDTKLDGDARIVTFSNGTVAREILVDCDDRRRRLVYAIVSERIKQHSASAQVFAESDSRTRFVWIADVLPNEIASYMDAQMDLGLLAMQKSLGRSAA